jgi:hypothetical protein
LFGMVFYFAAQMLVFITAQQLEQLVIVFRAPFFLSKHQQRTKSSKHCACSH